MGSGASALLDAASDLGLNTEQRKRYRAMYMELAKSGKTPKQIMAKLKEKIEEEKKTGVPSDSIDKTGEGNGNLLPTRKLSEVKRKSSLSGLDAQSGILTVSTDDPSAPTARSTSLDSTALLTPIKDDALFALGGDATNLAPENGEDAEVPNILLSLLEGITDESVQVSCKLCKVAFDTAAQLKRHINFSQLHAGNAKDYIEQMKTTIRRRKLGSIIEAAIKVMADAATLVSSKKLSVSAAKFRWWFATRKIVRQLKVEVYMSLLIKVFALDNGRSPVDPFNVLYEGKKLFWRTQEMLDIHMYLHGDVHTRSATTGGVGVVQVSGYNPQTKKEIESLFVSFEGVRQLVENQVKNEADKKNSNDKEAGLPRRKSLGSLSSVTTVSHEMIVDYIQSHIELVVVPSNISRQKLILSASAAGTSNISPFSSIIVNYLLGFGDPSELQDSLPLLKSNDVPLWVTNKISNSKSPNAKSTSALPEVSDPDESIHASIAALNNSSAQSQAHRLLSILVNPIQVWKLKPINLPMVAIARSLSGKAKIINSTIADLNIQKRELSIAANKAEVHSVVITEQLAVVAAASAAAAHAKPNKSKGPKRGGLSLETVSSTNRRRRNSIG